MNSDLTAHYALIGHPLGHSFSAKYFNEKFINNHINANYELIDIDNIKQFKNEILPQKKWSGFNVTIPYKTEIMPLLDEISEEAQEVGAVNTIKIKYDNNMPYLIGYNTDVIGFEKSIKPLLASIPIKALVLGTGGASKAVSYVLHKLQIGHIIVSRKKKPNTITYNELTTQIIKNHLLIINTTPLGMYPNIDSMPPLPYESITPNHILYDLVYNPNPTLFLRQGINSESTIKSGKEMLHLQADAAYSIWNNI